MSRTSFTYKDPNYLAKESSSTVQPQPDEEKFPPGKIRHNIERHIKEPRPEVGGGTQRLEDVAEPRCFGKHNARPPPPPPKRKERQHPFNDGVRDYIDNEDPDRGGVTDECISVDKNSTPKPKSNPERKRHSAKTDHVCRCDPGIQKYCLRENAPFCVCKPNDANGGHGTCCQPQIPMRITSDLNVPIGSKFYAHGERSKNRNKHRCSQETTKTSGDGMAQKQGPDESTERKTRGLFRNRNTECNDSSPPQVDECGEPVMPKNNEFVGDSAKHDHGKADKDRTRRSNPNTTTTMTDKNWDTIIRDDGWCLCCLLPFILLWLLILTCIIFYPGPYGLFAIIMSKSENCKSQMYIGLEP